MSIRGDRYFAERELNNDYMAYVGDMPQVIVNLSKQAELLNFP